MSGSGTDSPEPKRTPARAPGGDHAAGLLLWAPVALGLGIGLYFALPVEPPLSLAVAALLLLLLLRVTIANTSGTAKILLFGMILATTGVVLAGIRTLSVAGPVIARETRPLTLAGQIIRVEQRTDNSLRLLLHVDGLFTWAGEDWGGGREDWPRRVRVSVRTSAPALVSGDRVSMRAILTPPPLPVLPGGYDFARSAWFQSIGALGFSISAVTRLEETAPDRQGSFEMRVEGLRATVAGRVTAVIPGEAGGLAAALITGLRGGLNDEVRDNMRAAGLAHLLAISGLHMALVTGALFFGLRALLALSPRMALKYPIKKIAAVAAWAGAMFYLQLSGAGISTQRAFIMVSIVLLAVLLERQAISLRLVALAALVVLVFSPEALLSASFQMSFAAVAGLVAGFEWHQQRFGAAMAARRGTLYRAAWYLWGIVLATLIAEVTIGPVAAFHFHRVTLYGIPANIVAMPLMSFWIMPLGVLAMLLMPLGLESLALVPMGWGLEALIRVAGEVASLPGAVRPVPAMPFASFLLMVTGGLWLVLVRAPGWRRAAIVPLLLAVLPAALASKPDVLIGREGKIFAVLDAGGNYVFSTKRAGRFTRRSWLETYGQGDYEVWPSGGGSDKKGSINPGMPVRCDPVACIYTPPHAADSSIAFVIKREGFAEECRRADVLVSSHFTPRDCASALIIDGRVMRSASAMTLSRVDGADDGAREGEWDGAKDGEWRMKSVASTRGDRPWTRDSGARQ